MSSAAKRRKEDEKEGKGWLRPIRPSVINEKFAKLVDMRTNDEFCDVTICVNESGSQEQTMRAHWNVLAAASDYFRQMKSLKGKEAQEGVIRIQDTAFSTVRQLVMHCYEEEVTLNSAQETLSLLRAADKCLLADLKKCCAEILSGEVCLENCVSMLECGDQLSLSSLSTPAANIAAEHFGRLLDKGELSGLGVGSVKKALESDSLVLCEPHVFEESIRWAEKTEQTDKIHELLPSVRLSATTMWDVVMHPSVWGNDECRKVLDEIKKSVSASPSSYRNPVGEFELCARHWRPAPPMPGPRCDHGVYSSVLECGEKVLFFAGGFDGKKELNTIFKYNPRNGKKSSCGELPNSRRGLALVKASLGATHAFGGNQNGGDVVKVNNGKWVEAAYHLNKVSFCGVAVHEASYYIAGGERDGIATTDFHVITNDQRSGLPDLPTVRTRLCAAALNGEVWVIGGRNRDAMHDTVDIYSTETKKWRAGPKLPIPICDGGCALVDDQIVVAGGWTVVEGKVKRSDRVMVLRDGAWQSGPPLAFPRAGCRLAAIGKAVFCSGGTRDVDGLPVAGVDVWWCDGNYSF